MMIKFTIKYFIALCFLASSQVFAGYITTDLTEDTYITYKGYDWTWASSVNATLFSGLNPADDQWVENVFQDPTAHEGWMAIVDAEIKAIFAELTLEQFQKNGQVIQSAAYWNSHFVHVDVANFNERAGIKGGGAEYFETFYVRVSTPANVPEPSTLLIFAFGLLGLSVRKYIKK